MKITRLEDTESMAVEMDGVEGVTKQVPLSKAFEPAWKDAAIRTAMTRMKTARGGNSRNPVRLGVSSVDFKGLPRCFRRNPAHRPLRPGKSTIQSHRPSRTISPLRHATPLQMGTVQN